MPIVYRHRRLDTNEIFYVGIGKTKERAYNKSNNRSLFWKNIINKTKYKVEIIAENLSWEDACELEIFLIKLYGRKDLSSGFLVNLTDGGDGSRGHKRRENIIITKETGLKMSQSQKNKGIPIEQRIKMKNGIKNMSKEKRYNFEKNQFKPKKVINIDTNEIYCSAKEVSLLIGIKYATLKNWLSGKTINKSKYKYL